MNHKDYIQRITVGPLDSNAYLLGNEKEVLIIDPADEAETLIKHIRDRELKGIVITHGHYDHISAAVELRNNYNADVYLHPDDGFLWGEQHPGVLPNKRIDKVSELLVDGLTMQIIHTPGHTPGSTCYYVPELQVIFTGDTLFPDGPGATRWIYSDFDEIIESISTKIFTLPDDTLILPGHGEPTSIKAEKPKLKTWIERGW